MNNNDIQDIDKMISNHIKTYLVTNFLNSIMGGGEKTDISIHDVLSKKGTHIKIQELLPNVDASFIRKMIAILSINSDFCESMKNLGIAKEETEGVIISKLIDGFSNEV